jgi:hypothetical protein
VANYRTAYFPDYEAEMNSVAKDQKIWMVGIKRFMDIDLAKCCTRQPEAPASLPDFQTADTKV